MYNSDVLEIRKRFKKEKTTIGRITGCYVTGADKQIKTYIDTDFVDLEEAEQFKYIEILKKGLSGVLNKNLLKQAFVSFRLLRFAFDFIRNHFYI